MSMKKEYAFVSTSCPTIAQNILEMAEKGYRLVTIYAESFINAQSMAVLTGFYTIVFEKPA